MLEPNETVQRLEAALMRYRDAVSPAYDEVFSTVEQRYGENGHLSKLDIGGLVLWKRLQANTRWARDLNRLPDAEVQRVTGEAREIYLDARDADIVTAARSARRALSVLPGFVNGDALASAVLSAMDSTRLPIYDRRADAGLRQVLGRELSQGKGRYGRYVGQVHDLIRLVAEDRNATRTAREIDLALYTLGGD